MRQKLLLGAFIGAISLNMAPVGALASNCSQVGQVVTCDTFVSPLIFNIDSEGNFTSSTGVTGPIEELNIFGEDKLISNQSAVQVFQQSTQSNDIEIVIDLGENTATVLNSIADENGRFGLSDLQTKLQSEVANGSLTQAEADANLQFSLDTNLFDNGNRPTVVEFLTKTNALFASLNLPSQAVNGKVDETAIRMFLPRGVEGNTVDAFINGLSFDGNGLIDVGVAQQAVHDFIAAGNIGFEANAEHIITGGDNHGSIVIQTGRAGFQSDQQGPTDGDITLETNANILNVGGLNDYSNSAIVLATTDGDISLDNSGSIETRGDQGTGIIADSFGGGAISVINSGNILTLGESAEGIVLFSGEPDAGQGGDITLVNTGEIITRGQNSEAIDVANSSSGKTTVINRGDITTHGDGSTAIIASGDVEDSEKVTIENSGSLTMNGDYAVGIEGLQFSQTGLLHFKNSGDITANGANSYGIFSGALGGGDALIDITGGRIQGGSGDREFGFAYLDGKSVLQGSAGLVIGSNGDKTTVNNAGVITSLNGLAIQSAEGDFQFQFCEEFNQNDECTDLVTENISIASSDEIINNLADGQILGDVILGGGNDEIHNQGLIVGEVDLGTGANVFNNLDGGILFSGETLNVGSNNVFQNAGVFSPGGNDQILTTNITGNYVQNSTGKLVVDIDDRAAQKTDRVTVSGSADLRGAIIPNIISLDEIPNEFTVITTNDGIINNGLMVEDTAGFDFSVGLENGNKDLVLFSDPIGTISEIVNEGDEPATQKKDKNIERVLTSLSRFEDSGESDGVKLNNSLRLLQTEKDVADAVERLVPKSQEKVAGNVAKNNVSFSNAMLSCKQYDGVNRFTKEGQCYWGKVTGRRFDQDATSEKTGVKETAYELTTGIQYALEGDLRFGFAFGFEDSRSKSFSEAQALGNSDGKSYRGGIVLKNQWGPVNIYGNLVGNFSQIDHKRIVNLPGLGAIASAKQDVSSGLGRIRLSYLMDHGDWYLKPIVDVDATYLHLSSYTETGAGAANLTVNSSSEWIFGSTLSLELGGEHKLENGSLLRPYVRAGVRFISEDDMDTTVNFAGATAGLTAFQVNSELENVFGEFEAGMYFVSPQGFNLQVKYEGRYAEDSEQHAGSLKAALPF